MYSLGLVIAHNVLLVGPPGVTPRTGHSVAPFYPSF